MSETSATSTNSLRTEIAGLGALPRRVIVRPHAGDCFSILQVLLGELRESGARLAPAFVFVDPYGFKVPGEVLRDLMNAGRVELFVNLMWRELDMAVMQARSDTAMARVVDLVFDGSDWREGIDAGTSDKRADQAVDLLARKLSGRWATVVRMLGDNRATRYMLLHLTNHDEGRDLMKECAWKVCPDGSFWFARAMILGSRF